MSQVVLVHGSWMGAWEWDDVVSRLADRGHNVVTPELSAAGDMNAHCVELVDLLDSSAIEPGAIMVAHSYGGVPATAASAARPGAISKLIYLDAYVPRGKQCAFDILPDIKEALEANVTEDGYVAPLPLAAFGITDSELAGRIRTRMRRWPIATHTQAAPGVPDSVETVFLQLAQGQFFDALAADLEAGGWTVERLDLAHLAPVTHPEETTEALLRHI